MRMSPVRLFRRGPAGRRWPRDPAPTDVAAGGTPDGAAAPAGSATPSTPQTDPGKTAGLQVDTSAPEPGQDGDRHTTASPRTIRPCVPGGAAGAEYALPVPAG